MFGWPAMPQPRYVSCKQCGAMCLVEEADSHVCDPEKLLDYQLVRLRPEIAKFEHSLHEWLVQTPEGQFEAWYAERTRPERL